MLPPRKLARHSRTKRRRRASTPRPARVGCAAWLRRGSRDSSCSPASPARRCRTISPRSSARGASGASCSSRATSRRPSSCARWSPSCTRGRRRTRRCAWRSIRKAGACSACAHPGPSGRRCAGSASAARPPTRRPWPRALGRELADLRIDLDFAPVADVDTNPANPVIGDRSFSRDPDEVARHAVAFTLGLQREGVAACAKHFPGHGDTTVDSHLELPRIEHDRERLERVELVPFRAVAAAGVASMMTAHVWLPRVDPQLPATLSPAVLALLRDEIGYDGLVFSRRPRDARDRRPLRAGRRGARGARRPASTRCSCAAARSCATRCSPRSRRPRTRSSRRASGAWPRSSDASPAGAARRAAPRPTPRTASSRRGSPEWDSLPCAAPACRARPRAHTTREKLHDRRPPA